MSNNMQQQAMELQKKVAEAQQQLGELTVKGISGGGMAIAELTGKYDPVKLTINPTLLKEDAKTIGEVINAAYADAKTKADGLIDTVMGKALQGINLDD
ncbi:MAG: YbaB/EbfC family nucleoid-associated protein [Rickettsiales bacterium]|jgi:DNA-binding protein YbaB|nr:YbaB/EbfC family nucleoid-associated protein [Rickettsiales bacterium]